MSPQPYSREDIEEIRDAGNRNVAPLHTECWLATLDARDELLRRAADALRNLAPHAWFELALEIEAVLAEPAK